MTILKFAETIARHHAALQVGQPPSWGTCTPATDAALPPTTQAVLAACRRLGFIEADAQAIARAWDAQTQRLGAFDPLLWPCEPVDFGLPVLPCGTLSQAQPPSDATAAANHAAAGCRADAARGLGAFAPCPTALGLYAVLPDAAWVARMAQAGVPTLQLRLKSDDAAAIDREVAAAVAAVRGTPSRLVINDHWQPALAHGAYGVHLGQEDLQAMDTAHLQAIRSAGLRLGLSTHGYAEMLRAAALRPSYLALGAVFATTLKRMATAPQGIGRLTLYARLLRGWPLVAIGGIDLAAVPAIMASGVGSLAVVRAITAAPAPEQAARQLMQRMAQTA